MEHDAGRIFAVHDFLLAGLSFLVCGFILCLGRISQRIAGHRNLDAVQAMHTRPTPRLGGVGVFLGLGFTFLFVSAPLVSPYGKFILATSLLFLVGLAEDLGFGVSALRRLLAVCLASLLVMFLLGVWMPRTDIPLLDAGMGHWAIGIPVTLLVTAGIANGFNLIDGVNGLAAVTAIAGAVALGLIASDAGLTNMVHLTTMLAATVVGFLIWNFPFGRIFLGDAGAYTLGFVLSWFAIAILLRVPEASPWGLLLTLFWPVADTLLAIWRRVRRKAPTMAPDRLHVHQLVMRALEIHLLGRGKRHIANPLTTVVLLPFVVAPPIAGVMLWDDTRGAFLAVLAFTILFFGSYMLAFPLLARLQRQNGTRRQVTEPRLRDLRKARADEAASDPQTVQGHSTMARTISSTTTTASTS